MAAQQIYGILWDMDGVLVDTADLHYKTWSLALSEVGLSMSRAQFGRTFGMNNRSTLEFLLGRSPEPELVQRVSTRKETLFREAARGAVRPLPGARPWVQRLSQARDGVIFRQAVASSAPAENIDLLVDELGLRPYFQALVSAFAMPGKPDPAVFLQAARLLDLPPERCLVIEDGLAGVEAARRAGMKCLAVATTNPPEALEAASLVVRSLADLPKDGLLNLLQS